MGTPADDVARLLLAAGELLRSMGMDGAFRVHVVTSDSKLTFVSEVARPGGATDCWGVAPFSELERAILTRLDPAGVWAVTKDLAAALGVRPDGKLRYTVAGLAARGAVEVNTNLGVRLTATGRSAAIRLAGCAGGEGDRVVSVDVSEVP